MKPPIRQTGFRNGDLAGHGCTLASLAYAARHVGADIGDPEDYVARLQKLSGVPLATFRDRGTTLTEGKVAYLAAPGFVGRVGPRIRLMRGVDVRKQLLPELTDGRVAVVAVNYGEIQDAGKGVGRFRGGHAVVIGEPDGSHVTVADPLRSDLVRWRIDLLVRAMESFGKKPWMGGRGEAALVLPSPTWQEMYRRAKADVASRTTERDAAREEARLAKVAADELRSRLTTAEARITELENATPPDCTAAVNAAVNAEVEGIIAWVGLRKRGVVV